MNRFELIRRTLMWQQVKAAAAAKESELREQLTADARAEYAEQGTAPTWRLPDIGTVTLPVSKETVYVADEAAFLEWVASFAPCEMETIIRVRPAYRDAVLAGATGTSDGVVFDTATGIVVSGLAVRAAGAPGALSFRPTPMAKSIAAAGAEALVASVEKAIGEPIVLAEGA